MSLRVCVYSHKKQVLVVSARTLSYEVSVPSLRNSDFHIRICCWNSKVPSVYRSSVHCRQVRCSLHLAESSDTYLMSLVPSLCTLSCRRKHILHQFWLLEFWDTLTPSSDFSAPLPWTLGLSLAKYFKIPFYFVYRYWPVQIVDWQLRACWFIERMGSLEVSWAHDITVWVMLAVTPSLFGALNVTQ